MPEKIIFRETSPLLPETVLGVAGLSSDEYFSKVAHLKEELGSSQRRSTGQGSLQEEAWGGDEPVSEPSEEVRDSVPSFGG